MTDRRFPVVASLTIGVGLFVLGWGFHFDAARHKEAAAELTRKTSALVDQSSRLRHQLSEIEAKRLALSAGVVAEAKREPVIKAVSQPSWLELLRSDPAVQNRFLAYQRSSVVMAYQPLLSALKLRPEQIARFEENLAQVRADRMDLRSALASKGLASDDSAVQAFQVQLQADYEKAQKEVLGESGFEQWKVYEETSFAREVVRSAAGAATVAGLTLTKEQVKQLTDLVAAATKSSVAEGRGASSGTNWNKLDEESRAFLTPAQVEFIRTTEVIGPLGMGTRYQNLLNELITNADYADQRAKRAGAPR